MIVTSSFRDAGIARVPESRNTDLENLGKPVFMDSGLGPEGRPGMTKLSVKLKLRHYLFAAALAPVLCRLGGGACDAR